MARSSAGVATPTRAQAPTPSLSLLMLLLFVLYLSASCVEVSGAGAEADVSTKAPKQASGDLISPLATYDALDLPRIDGFSPSHDVLGFQILPDDYSKTPPPDLIPYDLALSSPSPSRNTTYAASASSPSPVSSDVVSPSPSSFSFPSDVVSTSSSPSPTPDETSTSLSDIFGNETAAPSVNSTQPPSKITHNDTPDTTVQPKITTFAPMDAPKSSSNAPVTKAGEEVESSDAGAYDLTRGPLSCSDVWPLLRKKDKGRCTYRWAAGAEYPEVLCELIGGYRRIAGSYTTLIHNAATYQVTSTRVGNASQPDGGWCAFQSRYEMRKVDTLPPGVPISENEALLQTMRSERGANGQESDPQLALVSQGFRAIRLDLRPDAIGAKGALRSDFHNCSSSVTNSQSGDDRCEPDVWVIAYTKQMSVVELYINRAWRVFMEFNPAFMSLANYLLRYLKAGAAVEELEVHGGERWDGTNVIPVALLRLRTLDFSRNGIAIFDKVNFQRMPNLQYLNLSFNNFASIPEGVSLLRGLRSLDLSHNPLIAPQLLPVLRPLLQLQVLNLSGTPLPSLDPLVPRKDPLRPPTEAEKILYPQLEILDVSSCNISDVASAGAHCLLKKVRKLHTFRLANNPLASVPNDLVEKLPSLQVLDLSGCRLTHPPALRLWPGVRLRLLDVSRNLLSSPAVVLSAQGGGAALLDVSGNPLRDEWGAHAFAALGPRAAVNLSRTELTALSAPMLRALRPLRLVDLGANPFDCAKCDIRHLQEWLKNDSGPSVLWLGESRPVQCAQPPLWRGRAVVEAPGPAPAQCAPPASSWSGVAVAGAVVVGALLAAAAIALLSLRFRLELTYVVHVLRANRSVKGAAAATGPGAECDFDAFVCYSKHDRPWVLGELLPRLEGSNPRYRLCLHERDFPLGSLIVQNIVECMARSRRTIMVLTPAFVGSQWCQWELEMATHRLLEGAGRDFLVLVELQPLDARALPRLLRLLVETRTFLQWPSGCAPGGCCGGGAEGAEEAAWRRLRAALGPPIKRSSRHGPSTPAPPNPALPPTHDPVINDNVAVAIVKDKEKDPSLFGGDIPPKNCLALDV